MTNDVFISYAREDQKVARRFALAFERPPRGWSVWWDADLTTGERFSNEIRDAISDSRCVVVLWSPHSVTSDWVAAEAEAARGLGILVPVLIGDCEPPMPFGPLHCADLRKWRGSETATEWSELLDAVQASFSRGPEVSKAERAARQRRLQAAERRRMRKKLGAIVAVGVLLGLAWMINSFVASSTVANQLADVSNELRDEVLATEPDKIWWWRLFDNRKNLEKLEASLLVAVEAVRKSPTTKARHALGDSFALLPWSDRGAEIDNKYEARTLAFNARGTRVVSAGALGDTLVWSLENAEVLARITHGHTGGEDWIRDRGWGMSAGAQMADIGRKNDLIATAGPDNSIRLWKSDGSAVRTMEHNDVTSIVQFSPGGDTIAATDESGELRLWATGTGELLHAWQHKNTRGSVTYSVTGDLLASVEEDGTVFVWDTASGKEVTRISGDDGAVGAMIFVPGKRQILTYEFGAAVWDIDSGQLLQRFADEEPVYSAIFDKHGKTLVLGGDSGLEWWNYPSGQRLFGRDAKDTIKLVADDDRKTLLTLSYTTNQVQAWDFETGRLLRRIPFARFVHSVAIDPNGKWLAVVGADWQSGKDVIEFAMIRPENMLAQACRFTSRNLSEGEWDGYIGDEPYRATCRNVE